MIPVSLEEKCCSSSEKNAVLQPQIDALALRASSFSVDLANQLAALNATMAIVQADIDSQETTTTADTPAS